MLQRRAYAYSGDGFVTAIDDLLAGSRRFGLDQTGRVTAVNGPGWGESYAYDPAGNVSAATWPAPLPGGPGAMPGPAGARPGHDAQGPREVTGTLITRAGNVRYRHDRQGRVIQRQVVRISRKPDTWHYHWDADSRLAAVTTPDHTTWRYRYDPFGRRIAKQRLTPDGDITEQTDFTWDGTVLAEQATTTAQPGQHQVITWDYRPGSFTALTQAEHTSPGELSEAPQEQIDQRFYSIIADLIGTPAELTAPDGTLAGCQRHTLWGTTVWDPGGAQTPLRFPGQYADPETGLHYNQHRYYDPAAGSYLTPDPLGLTPAPNPHAYVTNPQVLADPLGLAPYNTSPDLGMDPATGAFRQSEYDTAMRIQQERSVVLQRSSNPGVDWVDATGNTYDAVGNFSSKYFDQQWPNLRTRILDHMAKADFVPVDVSGFTKQQIAQVQQFIRLLGPSVFLVGQ